MAKMINEKSGNINTNTVESIITQSKDANNYLNCSQVRNKVMINWAQSYEHINCQPILPDCPQISDKVETNTIESWPQERTVSTTVHNDNSGGPMRHVVDVINSVAILGPDVDQAPNNDTSNYEPVNSFSANICQNGHSLANRQLILNKDSSDILNINQNNKGFDSVGTNSSTTINDVEVKNEPKSKSKRTKYEKKVSSDPKFNEIEYEILKQKKSPKVKSKHELKVKSNTFPINLNSNSVSSKKVQDELVFNESTSDKLLIDTINNGISNEIKVNKRIDNNMIQMKDNVTNPKTESKLKIARKKKIVKNDSDTAESNQFLNSFQAFLQKPVSTQIKYVPKKKSESRIHAEKAVKKSRAIKSNSAKIIRRKNLTKPLFVKNLSQQNSFMDFIVKKFPPIKDGVPFIQDRSCKDFASGISLCLDCSDDKKGNSHTCRFYQYRTLIKKDDQLSVYAFAEQENATHEDSKLWLPGSIPINLNEITAKFLLTFVGQQLCKIYTEENDVIGDSVSITWKKPVRGIRELCDVCQTTIFNTHWVCPTCGYAVCIDCYKSRVTDKPHNPTTKKNYDEFGWLLCNHKEKHDINNFHLTLFITKSVFGSVNDVLHKVRNSYKIMGTCDCGRLETSLDIHSVGRLPPYELRNTFSHVPQEWYCDDRLLVLTEPKCRDNINIFQIHWLHGDPVMVQSVHLELDQQLWTPESFSKEFGKECSSLVNCMNGKTIPKRPMRDFWDGFEDVSQRLLDQETGEEMLLKLKDWPPNAEFRDKLPMRFDNLMRSLPLPEYTRYDGIRNLSSRLPSFFVRPDLGPKMYCAYGSIMHPDKGTTNLHIDMSDAINVMIYVGVAKLNNEPLQEHCEQLNRVLLKGGCDQQMVNRVNKCQRNVGALWHIFRAEDANKIRDLLDKVAREQNHKIEPNNDPIHDQSWYLDETLRQRLYDEYGVKGFSIAQCLGDAILVPAGSPHQVQNLHSCIKVAGEFVSAENVSHCLNLTQEFRKLSKRHNNHEDKLQIKNIIYHAVKDSITCLCPVSYYPTPDPIVESDLVPTPGSIPLSQDLNCGPVRPPSESENSILNMTLN